MFGLTWENIRTRIVRRIGIPAMDAVEKGVQIFQVLRTEGVSGLWEMLVAKIGDLQEMVVEKVQDLVTNQVVKAGVSWLLGLLTPAGAFIKACKLIYDIVMFFVNNAARLGEFVTTVLDSVTDIVKGNVGGVAEKIENSLGQMLPLIINFLASVAGLGGIGQKNPRRGRGSQGAGEQGGRLRDHDGAQARRADHSRVQECEREGEGQSLRLGRRGRKKRSSQVRGERVRQSGSSSDRSGRARSRTP